MLALVHAKHSEFIEDLQVDDPRVLKQTKGSKWDRVSLSVNASAGISCYRSPDACKYKWQTLLLEYKKVANLYREIGTNSLLYFEMTFG
jgi:hypothetical protein